MLYKIHSPIPNLLEHFTPISIISTADRQYTVVGRSGALHAQVYLTNDLPRKVMCLAPSDAALLRSAPVRLC